MTLKHRSIFSGGVMLVLSWACVVDEVDDYRGAGADPGFVAEVDEEDEQELELLAFEPGAGLVEQGDCCSVQETPGCADPKVEKCVCEFDSFCCNVEWDALCVGEAIQFCGAVCKEKQKELMPGKKKGDDKKDDGKKDDGKKWDGKKWDGKKGDGKKDDGKKGDPYDPTECFSGNCCVPRNEPGCEVPEIEACVCENDPFCCGVYWDVLCVGDAITKCGAKCEEEPPVEL